jgi:hypothetical protein
MCQNRKKDLTAADKSDKIWVKLKVKAQQIGYGKLQSEIIVHDGAITTIHVWPPKETITADNN